MRRVVARLLGLTGKTIASTDVRRGAWTAIVTGAEAAARLGQSPQVSWSIVAEQRARDYTPLAIDFPHSCKTAHHVVPAKLLCTLWTRSCFEVVLAVMNLASMMQQMNKWLTAIAAAALVVSAVSATSDAGTTEPRLALMRARVDRSANGRTTLTLEGSFSFGDTVQLAIPLNVMVTQGQLTARLDLAGNVFVGDQPASGPGVISIAERQIVAVLPPQFAAGDAIVQVVATFDGKPLATNRLHVTL